MWSELGEQGETPAFSFVLRAATVPNPACRLSMGALDELGEQEPGARPQ